MSSETASPKVAIIGMCIVGLLMVLFYYTSIMHQLHPSSTGHGETHVEESHGATGHGTPASGSSGHGSGHE